MTVPGLTSLNPLPRAPYRRWNGQVWPLSFVDQYNLELDRIRRAHSAGHDTDRLVNGLYNLAHSFDYTN